MWNAPSRVFLVVYWAELDGGRKWMGTVAHHGSAGRGMEGAEDTTDFLVVEIV
jgi:hypothetical protein